MNRVCEMLVVVIWENYFIVVPFFHPICKICCQLELSIIMVICAFVCRWSSWITGCADRFYSTCTFSAWCWCFTSGTFKAFMEPTYLKQQSRKCLFLWEWGELVDRISKYSHKSSESFDAVRFLWQVLTLISLLKYTDLQYFVQNISFTLCTLWLWTGALFFGLFICHVKLCTELLSEPGAKAVWFPAVNDLGWYKDSACP